MLERAGRERFVEIALNLPCINGKGGRDVIIISALTPYAKTYGGDL